MITVVIHLCNISVPENRFWLCSLGTSTSFAMQLIALRPISVVARLGRFCRAMSATPRNSDYLINDPKYSWLKSLGIHEHNPGVFDGVSWNGSGPVCLLRCLGRGKSHPHAIPLSIGGRITFPS